MIDNWQDFLIIFGFGLAAGFTAGFSALAVRVVRNSFSRYFRSTLSP